MATAPQPTARIATPRRTRWRRFTDADFDKIRQWTLAGVSGKEIAIRLNRPRSIVSKIQRHRLGLDPRAIRLLLPPPPPKPAPPAPLPRVGTWRLSRADAESLREWKEHTAYHGSADAFVAEILQVSLADFRRKSVPANDTAPPSDTQEPIDAPSDMRHTKLRAEQIQKIRQLRREQVPVSELAKRFGVTHSTIRRVLESTEEEE